MTRRSEIVLIFAIALVAGCGGGDLPELGRVTGRVTLDGTPLEAATIRFTPEKGRTSTGITDAEGHYELYYIHSERGALIGRHAVAISTYQPGEADFDGTGEPFREAPERIPAKYNESTILNADVKPEANTFDFDLSSDGDALRTPQKVGD